MGYPVWITKSGNLGTIPEQQFWTYTIVAEDSEEPEASIFFELVAGEPPRGIHIHGLGRIEGNPETFISILGVPTNVSQATTSRFAVRARSPEYFEEFIGDGSTTHFNLNTNISFDIYKVQALVDGEPINAYYEVDDTQNNNITIILTMTPDLNSEVKIFVYSLDSQISDRTFELTVVGQNAPDILNTQELIGLFIEGQFIDYQLNVIDLDQDDLTFSVVNGGLPPGITLNSDTQKITGYVEPIAFSTSSSTDYRSYTFGVLVDDGNLQDLKGFEIRVIPTQLMAVSNTITTVDSNYITTDRTTKHSPIVYTEAGELGPVKHDNYFMFKFDGRDFDSDVIIYEFDLGEGVGFDQVESPYDTDPFDTTVTATVVEGAFPPGLTLDEDTGWLYGYIPPHSDLLTTYAFYVRARKKFVTEISYPLGGDPVPYYSDRKQYQLTVVGEELGTLTWVSDPFLGSIDNGGISELKIEATVDNGNTLYYELVLGEFNKMPAALKLLDNGLIVGRASFATFSIDAGTTTFDIFDSHTDNETTFDQTYRFTVRVYDLEGTVNTSREFTILINKENIKPYENLYVVSRLPLHQRTKIESILTNTEIISTDDIYRPEDTYFGLQKELRMLVVNGLNPLTASTYATAMNILHYPKEMYLGDIKTAKVVDEDFNTRYEVIYIEVKDTTDNIDGTPTNSPINIAHSNVIGQSLAYPNNITNIRKQMIKEIGQINKELPEWMIDRQDNGRVLGFTKGCVLAYVKPGKSAKIAYQLSKLKDLPKTSPNYIDFKKMIFEVDRYVWDSELSINFNKETQKFVVAPETTFDTYSERYLPSINEQGLKVYPFNSDVLVHEPDEDGQHFHPDEPLGHYGSEYPLDPDSLPNAQKTTFDMNSLRFLIGKDEYTPQDHNDKYLVFPNKNILNT